MDLFEYVNDIMDFFKNPIWKYLYYGIIFILIIVWLAFIYWTYRDARLRSESPAVAVFWAVIVLLLNFLGLILYLILRPPEFIDDIIERDLEIEKTERLLYNRRQTCPACGKPVNDDFLICPYCRKKLKTPCINCGKPLKLDWKVCPYCKTSQ
ncbi:MAG: zinc ribbon domain-containing protein [Actinomycetota bacterium]|nr:zinc ribbon domain-containing protein [Actinomycetota bacterium]